MNHVKVSIIIPVYNCPAQFLRQCLESLVGQTLQELQIICVDDCSTDGSLAIVEEYAQKDPRILLIKQPQNTGISQARNTGAGYVTGEYLYFMDCDDYLAEEALEELYAVAEEKQLEVVLFEGEAFFESPEIAEDFPKQSSFLQYKNPPTQVVTGVEMMKAMVEPWRYYGFTWLILYRREFYQNQGFFFHPQCPGAGDDSIVCFQTFLHAEKMLCVQKIYYHYCIRAGSGTTKVRKYNFFRGHFFSQLQMLLSLKEAGVPVEGRDSFFKAMEYTGKIIGENYRIITSTDPAQATETLFNARRLLFAQAPVRLANWQKFALLREKEPEFCFFGAGKRGKKMIEFFRDQGITLPLAICDNSPKLWGSQIQGIPVISFEEALEQYKNLSIVVTNRLFYQEINQQLREKLPEDRILELYF